MGIVFIAFLVYTFIPLKKKDEKQSQLKHESAPVLDSHQKGDDYFGSLNQRLEEELDRSFGFFLDSPLPFQNYPVENLKLILAEKNHDQTGEEVFNQFFEFLEKANRIGFYDLSDLFRMDSYRGINKRLKFNIYIALFMLKLKDENILQEVLELPDIIFKKIVNCRPYHIIDNEVVTNFQCFPVLFYFYSLVERLNIFPQSDSTGFFCERIGDICDLSPKKFITRSNDFLSFSVENQKYRISWIEEDHLSPDDHGTYANLMLKTFVFLKQSYLLFPDFQNHGSNIWLEELRRADSGDIELTELKIASEDAAKNLQIQTIFYMPGKSQFVALLKGYDFSREDDFLYRVLHRRIMNFQNTFLSVKFASRFLDPKSFKKELLNFGIYLKTQVPIK